MGKTGFFKFIVFRWHFSDETWYDVFKEASMIIEQN